MSNSTRDRGNKGLFAGFEKGLRLALQPYRNQIARGMKDLAAQIPAPKGEHSKGGK